MMLLMCRVAVVWRWRKAKSWIAYLRECPEEGAVSLVVEHQNALRRDDRPVRRKAKPGSHNLSVAV